MSINYVRFQRGTQEAYDALKDAGKLDNNTLYFIYDNASEGVGALYMGTRIISGGDVTIASANLNDLADVIVTGAGTDSFLVKGENNTWIAKSLEDVINLIKDNISNENSSLAQIFQVVANNNETDQQAIERIIGDSLIASGDIVVVKHLIVNDNYQHTAYVYNGESWIAMDGNYNIETIYFDNDLTITANIGVQEIDETGSKTLETTGKNLRQVLDMLFAARKLPDKVEPVVSVTSNESKSYEVGTIVTPSFNATLSSGSYSYGPDTAIIAKSWKAEFNGETINSSMGTFKDIEIKDTTNTRIKVTATYGDGAIPKDNLGNLINDANELNQCQIKAGESIGYTSSYFKGFRNMYYGSKVNAIDLNSKNIRELTSKISTSSSATVTIVDNATQVIIAVPVGRKVTKVADEGAFGTDLLPKMNHSVISVGGADATAENIGNNAKNYNVYVYAPDTALGANTYTVTITNE